MIDNSPVSNESIDDLIFDKFSQKWQKTISSLARLLDIPVAIIFKKEDDSIRVIVTNEENDNNPFSANDTIPIEGSFCNYVFRDNDKFVVSDYREIDLDINNVATQADFISYLGYPLTWPDGEVFGTICFLDDTRNYYSNGINEFLESLKDLLNDSLQLIDNTYRLVREKNTVQAELETEKVNANFKPMCPNCQQVQHNDSWIQVNQFLIDYPEELVKTMPSDWGVPHSCN